jgi:hypothetical protein
MKTLKQKLDAIHEAKQERTIVKNLKEHEDFVLRTILQGNFSDIISFPFPSGEPPFEHLHEEVEVVDNHMMKLAKCTKNAKLDLIQKEMSFIKLLESIGYEDAKIICKIKDGDLEDLYPRITKNAVQKAFPNLL